MSFVYSSNFEKKKVRYFMAAGRLKEDKIQ